MKEAVKDVAVLLCFAAIVAVAGAALVHQQEEIEQLKDRARDQGAELTLCKIDRDGYRKDADQCHHGAP